MKRKFKIRIYFGDYLGIMEYIGFFKSRMQCENHYEEMGVRVMAMEVV